VWDAQDSVRARTKYLNDNSSAKEMPRFVRLKQSILADFQEESLKNTDIALKEAQTEKPVFEMLSQVKDEFVQSRDLIAKRLVAEDTQQQQVDSMDTVKDMMKYLSVKKVVNEAAEENKRRNGKDAFDRDYLVRDKDLDATLAVVSDVNHATMMQSDFLRKAKRFSKVPPKSDTMKKMEEANRARAGELQTRLIAMAQAIPAKAAGISPEVKARVDASGITSIGAFKSVSLGQFDKDAAALLAAQEESVNLLAQTIQNIRTLLEERIMSKVELAALKPVEVEQISAEEFEKRQSNEYLLKNLKNDTSLPPEIRDIMLRALGKEFPPKYKGLISAYYASFLQGQQTQPPKKEEKKQP
jgi:hypothetical protein